MEISSVANTDYEFSLKDDNDTVCDNSKTTCDDDERPPRRKAAAKAQERILEQLVLFFPFQGVSQREHYN